MSEIIHMVGFSDTLLFTHTINSCMKYELVEAPALDSCYIVF